MSNKYKRAMCKYRDRFNRNYFKRDECGEYKIVNQGLVEISTYTEDGKQLGMWVMGDRLTGRMSNLIKRKIRGIPGLKYHQSGHPEFGCNFPKEHLMTVCDIVGMKRKGKPRGISAKKRP